MGAKTIEELVTKGPFGKTALYEAIREGRLVARKFGRKTVVTDEDHDAFINSLPRLDETNKVDTHHAAVARQHRRALRSKAADETQRKV